MTASDAFFEGFLSDYFAEAAEHLTSAADALLQLEKSIGNPAAQRAAVDDLFRYFHTLKAISAMVELRPAEQLAHHLEHYLRAIREGDVSLSPAGTDALIEGLHRLEQIIGAHRAHREQPSISDIVSRIDILVRPRERPPLAHALTPVPADTRQWICRFAPTRELLASGTGVDAIRKRLGEIGTIVEAVRQLQPDGTIVFQFTLLTAGDIDAIEVLRSEPVTIQASDVAVNGIESDVEVQPLEEAGVRGQSETAPSHVVRVDLARLDHLM